jgi:hypothetical protein
MRWPAPSTSRNPVGCRSSALVGLQEPTVARWLLTGPGEARPVRRAHAAGSPFLMSSTVTRISATPRRSVRRRAHDADDRSLNPNVGCHATHSAAPAPPRSARGAASAGGRVRHRADPHHVVPDIDDRPIFVSDAVKVVDAQIPVQTKASSRVSLIMSRTPMRLHENLGWMICQRPVASFWRVL